MARRTYLLLAFLFLSVIHHIGSAQAQKSYSLQESIDLALQNNPKVVIARKEIKASKARASQSVSLEQPELSLAWDGITRSEGLSKAKERTIGLEQTIEFPSKLWLRKSISSKEIQIGFLILERTEAVIASEVKKAYWLAAYRAELKQALEFNLELLRQFQEMTLLKYQVNECPYLEVVRAKLEIAKTQNEILEVGRELGSAKSELNQLMGRPGSEDFEFEDSLSYVPLTENKEETFRELTQSNRTLKIAQISREKEGKNLSLAKSGFLPDFRFAGGFLSEEGGEYLPSFELSMSVPLWWWGPKARVRENQVNRNIAQLKEQITERSVKTEIEKAFQVVKSSEEQVLLFQQSLLPEIEEELKVGVNSYRYDQIDALNLLDIYRTSKESQMEYHRVVYNYLSALAELEVAGEERTF